MKFLLRTRALAAHPRLGMIANRRASAVADRFGLLYVQ